MNKAEFIEAVAAQSQEKKSVVADVLEGMVAVISSTDEVRLAGFGNFVLNTREAHKARNPRTGLGVMAAEKTTFWPDLAT